MTRACCRAKTCCSPRRSPAWNNYTRDFGDLAKDAEAMKQFGNSMVMWNFHTRQPKKVFQVPGAPLEIRWAWGESTITPSPPRRLVRSSGSATRTKTANGRRRKSRTSAAEGGVLPVDISLSADDKTLFVIASATASAASSTCRIRISRNRFTRSKSAGRSTWCRRAGTGRRLYFTSSLLARWDKKGDDNEQFVRAYAWDGKELKPTFELDFTALKLGRPHHMLFGSTKIGKKAPTGSLTKAHEYGMPMHSLMLMALVFARSAQAPADLPRTADHDYDAPAPGSYTLTSDQAGGRRRGARCRRAEPFNSANWLVVESRS